MTIGRKIYFVAYCIVAPKAIIFIIHLNFIFTLIIEIFLKNKFRSRTDFLYVKMNCLYVRLTFNPYQANSKSF